MDVLRRWRWIEKDGWIRSRWSWRDACLPRPTRRTDSNGMDPVSKEGRSVWQMGSNGRQQGLQTHTSREKDGLLRPTAMHRAVRAQADPSNAQPRRMAVRLGLRWVRTGMDVEISISFELMRCVLRTGCDVLVNRGAVCLSPLCGKDDSLFFFFNAFSFLGRRVSMCLLDGRRIVV